MLKYKVKKCNHILLLIKKSADCVERGRLGLESKPCHLPTMHTSSESRFHSVVDEGRPYLGYCVMLAGNLLPTFRRDLLPSPSC